MCVLRDVKHLTQKLAELKGAGHRCKHGNGQASARSCTMSVERLQDIGNWSRIRPEYVSVLLRIAIGTALHRLTFWLDGGNERSSLAV